MRAVVVVYPRSPTSAPGTPRVIGTRAIRVWPITVVLDPPIVSKDLHLGQRMEHFAGEELAPKTPVERLADPVLPRRTRIDERGIHTGETAPIAHRVRGHLRTVVHPDMRRYASGLGDDPLEHPDQLIRGTGPKCLRRKGLSGELIDDTEKPHLAAVDRGIDLEVQRPHLVRIRGP